MLDEAIRVVKQLEPIVHNIYESNAVELGEWKTASHTEHAPTGKEQEPPTPPTSSRCPLAKHALVPFATSYSLQ